MTAGLLHYEDLAVGESATFGATPVVREEVIAFASRFDPQGFHLDDRAAANSPFGKVAASGWHTSAMSMRMLVDHRLSRMASLGGAGVDKLRWHKPVYPGDTLSLRTTLLAKRRSKSQPGLGLIISLQETLNQHGEVVMSLESTGLIAVRHPEAPIAD